MQSSISKSLPWKEAKDSDLRSVGGICFDIDDTITFNGKLRPDAYSALWRLKEAGFKLVPVTGRSAAWCDHFVRFWPIDAVVGENGAFTFFMKDGVRKRLDTLGADSFEVKNRLKDLAAKIKEKFPNALWASDQDYREYDLAIDICEDVPPWETKKVWELLEFCKREGALAKLSSIHVNTWFGDYDKAKGIKTWLDNGALGIEGEIPSWDEWIFIGDSPNDEPLFSNFHLSVGVANLEPFLLKMNSMPVWITQEESGEGFVEFANRLIDIRN